MKDRILQFLTANKITPSEFADRIGVQRSSMSHILNGRNQPSAAFLQKMVITFPEINARWLMVGEGQMIGKQLAESIDSQDNKWVKAELKSDRTGNSEVLSDLFAVNNGPTDVSEFPVSDNTNQLKFKEELSLPNQNQVMSALNIAMNSADQPAANEKVEQHPLNTVQSSDKKSDPPIDGNPPGIEQVVFFYANKTFTAYRPS